MIDKSPRDRIEQYYATVPLLFAEAEDHGSLRLFVRREPGTPYYGGPSHARPASDSATVTATDIARVRTRQRELGVPESFEWLAEVTPTLRARVEAAGLPVAERPLMTLPRNHQLPPQPLPEGITLRTVTADDPALPAVLALPTLSFTPDTTAGPRELATATGKLTADGTPETTRPSLRAGHKVLIAAFTQDDTPLAAGHYHPCHGTTEIGGVCTLPTARRQGLAAAVTTALATHARTHDVHTVFLAYAEERVARLYAGLGFRPTDTTLLIANQPARGQ
ncbi:GNAT family N-acetyltransferase [Streptomyces sp. NPDC014995]|uniref:GNAT family N-acetyltransferase n=1 Tax=Streptomyces sp. NPDC014995 TaxID=3364936 RepID=UPI0037019B08